MSAKDRAKWDQRYREGAYQQRLQPSQFLESCKAWLPETGRALDVACGAGRNALYLASRGLAVDAVDISAEALGVGQARERQLRETGAALGALRWIEHDLDRGFEPTAPYDVILNVRFVDMALLQGLLASLAPNGLVIVEQHLLVEDADVIGPRDPAFRITTGTLGELAAGLTTLVLDEGTFTDPDGRPAALARLCARRLT